MTKNSTSSISEPPIALEDDTLDSTSDRWSDPATVFDLAHVDTHDCCGLPADSEHLDDCSEIAASVRQMFAPGFAIQCRPAKQWGAR